MLTQRSFLLYLPLIAISILILVTIPNLWYYTPDSGIYIGTAINMLNQAEYTFNGYPNLQYYPGFSTLLLLPVSIFGLDFYYLNLFSALIVIVLLWTFNRYFNVSKYGAVIILLPLILVSCSIFQKQIYQILSDGPFLLIVILVALLWREYIKTQSNKMLFFCLLLASIAPLIRFEGLFVVLSISLSFLIREYRVENKILSTLFTSGIISTLIFLPFALWTYRNYQLHTSDTYNMANRFFFGLKGLSLYAPEFGKVDWIDVGSPKYGLYNLYYNIQELSNAFIGYAVDLNTVYGKFFRYLFFMTIGIFGLYGIKGWFKQANTFELSFVIVLSLFIIYRSLTSGSLYVVSRYWLPLLPFYISIVLIGYNTLINKLTNKYFKFTVMGCALIVLVTIFSNGAKLIYDYNCEYTQKYYSQAETTLQSMANYINKKISKDAVIAVTDWGVIPLYMQRKSIQILNDDSLMYKLSLERIHKFNAEYLVILDRNAAFYRSARAMTKALPSIFQLESDFSSEDKTGPLGSIYKINNNEVSLVLHNQANQEMEKQ